MNKLLLLLFILPVSVFAQIGSVKTEKYQAEFEKKQSIELVADYTDTIKVPVQLLKIGTCGCGRSPTGNCIGWHGLSESEYQAKLASYIAEQDKGTTNAG